MFVLFGPLRIALTLGEPSRNQFPCKTTRYTKRASAYPLKLFEKGKLNESLAEIYRANVRTPEYNWGDLTAQLGAMSVIEDEMHLLIGQYGLQTVVQARDDVLDWSEEKSRNVIRTMPTGTFEFVELLDDDGITDIPVAIQVRMTIRSDGIRP